METLFLEKMELIYVTYSKSSKFIRQTRLHWQMCRKKKEKSRAVCLLALHFLLRKPALWFTHTSQHMTGASHLMKISGNECGGLMTEEGGTTACTTIHAVKTPRQLVAKADFFSLVCRKDLCHNPKTNFSLWCLDCKEIWFHIPDISPFIKSAFRLLTEDSHCAELIKGRVAITWHK